MYRKIYINVLEYLCSYKYYTHKLFLKKEIRRGMSMNVNEEMLAGTADPNASYPDADPNAT